MNADAVLLERSWNRRTFRMVLAGAFLVQLALIFFLGRKPPVNNTEAAVTPSYRMLVQTMAPEKWDSMLIGDPTLFVLPSYDSFSGSAWMQQRPVDYSPTEWSEPPHWLALPQEKLTKEFQKFVQTSAKPLLQVAQKSAPLEPSPILFDGVAQSTQRLSVEGDIAARLIGELPELSAWPNAEPLDRSVVQIAVNEAGQVVSARLVSRSGLFSADQNALRLAAGLRFAPVAVTSVVWGRVIFPWRTEPLPINTNTIPAMELR